jgi:hypothetical protein
MGVWYSLWPFGTFFPVLVCLDREKSGSPDANSRKSTHYIFLMAKINKICLFNGGNGCAPLTNAKQAWVQVRVARFFLVQSTKMGKNIPNYRELCQMSLKYNKRQ